MKHKTLELTSYFNGSETSETVKNKVVRFSEKVKKENFMFADIFDAVQKTVVSQLENFNKDKPVPCDVYSSMLDVARQGYKKAIAFYPYTVDIFEKDNDTNKAKLREKK